MYEQLFIFESPEALLLSVFYISLSSRTLLVLEKSSNFMISSLFSRLNHSANSKLVGRLLLQLTTLLHSRILLVFALLAALCEFYDVAWNVLAHS